MREIPGRSPGKSLVLHRDRDSAHNIFTFPYINVMLTILVFNFYIKLRMKMIFIYTPQLSDQNYYFYLINNK